MTKIIFCHQPKKENLKKGFCFILKNPLIYWMILVYIIGTSSVKNTLIHWITLVSIKEPSSALNQELPDDKNNFLQLTNSKQCRMYTYAKKKSKKWILLYFKKSPYLLNDPRIYDRYLLSQKYPYPLNDPCIYNRAFLSQKVPLFIEWHSNNTWYFT